MHTLSATCSRVAHVKTEEQVNPSTSRCKPIETHMQMNHGNTKKHTARLNTWFSWSKNKKTHTNRDRVTEQVSRTSCDKDTIESGEKEENEDLEI